MSKKTIKTEKRQLLAESYKGRPGMTRAKRHDFAQGGRRGAIQAALNEMSDLDWFVPEVLNDEIVRDCY